MSKSNTDPVVKKEPAAATPAPTTEDSPKTKPKPASSVETSETVSGSVPTAEDLSARTVQYSRFAEVNAARRKAETELATLQANQVDEEPVTESTDEKNQKPSLPDPVKDPAGYAEYVQSVAARAATESLAPYLAAKRETELAAKLTAARTKYPLADPELTTALLALNPDLEIESAAAIAHERVSSIRTAGAEDYKQQQIISRRGAAESGGVASAATESRPRTIEEATEVATRVLAKRLGS